MKKNIIFDLGFFNGNDTENYLNKGYKVVAVEMNENLYKIGKEKFKKFIDSGDLTLHNNAFSETVGEEIIFYMHEKNLDWSTCDKNKTKFWNCEPTKHKTVTVNLEHLINTNGEPFYIKTDIEGFDYMVLTQLLKMKERPKFLSFELSRLDYWKTFSFLHVCGYKHFQLINQIHNKSHSSGEFGDYLPDKWMSFDECLTKYMKYKELKEIDNVNLAIGWIDIHAKY